MFTMVLNFVPADQAPLEWRDGRELLALTNYEGTLVVWWRERHGWIWSEDTYSWPYEVKSCKPTYLAEIPDMPDI